jgi:hypothetical protein
MPDNRIHGLTGEKQQIEIRGRPSIRERLTPRQAVREHCIDCVGGASAVRDCQEDELYDRPCIFFPYRMGSGRPSAKLIRKFCLYCMGGNQKLVRECPSKACPFLAYRMGKIRSSGGGKVDLNLQNGLLMRQFPVRNRRTRHL